MPGGHNAKPDEVLKLHGNYREDRHGKRGVPDGGQPLCKPDGLRKYASWLWDEVTRTRKAWLATSDAAALETLCNAYHLMKECEKLLLKEPNDKNTRCNYDSYSRLFDRLSARFGLTPSDRARLGESQEENQQNDKMKEMLA